MNQVTYSQKLQSPQWQKKRLEVLARDKFTCQKCGDKDTTLHVHHKAYPKGLEPWDVPDSMLITVCKHCHFILEAVKKEDVTCNGISKVDYTGTQGMIVAACFYYADNFFIVYTYDIDNDSVLKEVVRINKSAVEAALKLFGPSW